MTSLTDYQLCILDRIECKDHGDVVGFHVHDFPYLHKLIDDGYIKPVPPTDPLFKTARLTQRGYAALGMIRVGFDTPVTPSEVKTEEKKIPPTDLQRDVLGLVRVMKFGAQFTADLDILRTILELYRDGYIGLFGETVLITPKGKAAMK